MASVTAQTEEDIWREFVQNFCIAAIIQGRIAYCLMSIHAVNPNIFSYFSDGDILYSYLWANMVYGISVMIYTRPSLREISPFNRFMFSIMGSYMFNGSSMRFYNWLYNMFPDSPYLLTFLGFISGKIMMAHLLAFLYHIDTRTNVPGVTIRRDPAFERMYLS